MTELENFSVEDNEEEKRFEIKLGNQAAFVTYEKSPNFITYYHTEVPPEFEGRGIAKKLTVYALDYARQNDLQVNALCPFIAAYVKRHPDYEDLLSPASRKRIFGE